jgi:hypothetical protein
LRGHRYAKFQREVKGLFSTEAVRRDFVVLAHTAKLPDGRYAVAGMPQ